MNIVDVFYIQTIGDEGMISYEYCKSILYPEIWEMRSDFLWIF